MPSSHIAPPLQKRDPRIGYRNLEDEKLAQRSRKIRLGMNSVRFYVYGLAQKRLLVELQGTKLYLRHFDAQVSTDMTEDLLSLHKSQMGLFFVLIVFQRY